jgi:quercetin dioxygenase-like cupin family protein
MYPTTPFFRVDLGGRRIIKKGTGRRSIRLGEVLFMFISFDRPTLSPLHDHQWDSIIYIDEGEFEVTVGDEQKRLVPGQGTVIPAGVKHTLTTDAGSRIIEVWYPYKEEDV